MTAAKPGRRTGPDAAQASLTDAFDPRSSRGQFAAIFACALVLRAGYVLALYAFMGPNGLMIEDSAGYLAAAADFARHGAMMREGAGGLRPETGYMPLYPLYLAGYELATKSANALWPVLGQAVIDSGTCVIIARLAWLFRPRYALIAGLFAAVNPTQIVIAGMVLTESVFLFWCALALLAAAAWMRGPSRRWALILGVALGFGVATRAMLLPWALAAPLLLAAGAALDRRMSWQGAGQLLAALALALALQAPILARNLRDFDAFGLTSQAGAYALLWIAPLVKEARDGTAHTDGAVLFGGRFEATVAAGKAATPFERSRAMSRFALQVIGELGAAAVAKAYAIGAAINLLSPAVVLSAPVRTLPRAGFYATPGASKLAKVKRFLFHNDNPIYGWVLLTGVAGVALLRLIQLRGLARMARAGRAPCLGVLLLLAWIAFLLAINGPVASAKYRQPAEPAFAVLFALGWPRSRPAVAA